MTPTKQYYKNAAETVIKNLKKRNMEGYYAETCEDAVAIALSLMPEGSSIGWGGSVTLSECGLMDAVKSGKYNIIDRDEAKTPAEAKELYTKIFNADFFLMSTNAITYNGELINVDGRSNRVSYLCYGPENVIIVTGMNKLVVDVDEGIKRARNVAAPKNTVRLKKKTPCSVTGKCADCLSPDCICMNTVITRASRFEGRIKVILIGEELGY